MVLQPLFNIVCATHVITSIYFAFKDIYEIHINYHDAAAKARPALPLSYGPRYLTFDKFFVRDPYTTRKVAKNQAFTTSLRINSTMASFAPHFILE